MIDDIASVIIIGFVILIVVVFFIYLLALALTSSPRVVGVPPIPCQPGQCATNIFNGEKSCPPQDQIALIDPSFQVCNSPNVCDNQLTPYALQDDGSAISSGTCQPGVTCRCLRQPQCADYIVSIFESINGNPFTTLEGSHTAFTQTSNGVDPNTGQIVSVPPIPYTDPLTSFCTVPLEWLNRSAPGCNFAAEMTLNSLIECMDRDEACLVGTLAFLAVNPDTFTSANINTTPLACVRGVACPSGQVAIWNNSLGEVVCKTI